MARANRHKRKPGSKGMRKNPFHWVLRFIKEMKQNPGVVKKVSEGELDYALNFNTKGTS